MEPPNASSNDDVALFDQSTWITYGPDSNSAHETSQSTNTESFGNGDFQSSQAPTNENAYTADPATSFWQSDNILQRPPPSSMLPPPTGDDTAHPISQPRKRNSDTPSRSPAAGMMANAFSSSGNWADGGRPFSGTLNSFEQLFGSSTTAEGMLDYLSEAYRPGPPHAGPTLQAPRQDAFPGYVPPRQSPHPADNPQSDSTHANRAPSRGGQQLSTSQGVFAPYGSTTRFYRPVPDQPQKIDPQLASVEPSHSPQIAPATQSYSFQPDGFLQLGSDAMNTQANTLQTPRPPAGQTDDQFTPYPGFFPSSNPFDQNSYQQASVGMNQHHFNQNFSGSAAGGTLNGSYAHRNQLQGHDRRGMHYQDNGGSLQFNLTMPPPSIGNVQQPSTRRPRPSGTTKRSKQVTMPLRGLYGNDGVQTQVRGSREAISVLQGVITQAKLMIATNADTTVPDALTTTLQNLVDLGAVTSLDQLWNNTDEALDSVILRSQGFSDGDIDKINEPLPDGVGEPAFKGRRTGRNHASYAFRVCKSLTKKHERQHGGYQFLVTTEYFGQQVQVQLFSAADKPAHTVCLHRTIKPDGTESWKPYRLRSRKPSPSVAPQLPEEMELWEEWPGAASGGTFGMPTQSALPPLDPISMPSQPDQSVAPPATIPKKTSRASRRTAERKAKKGCMCKSKLGKEFYQGPSMPRSGVQHNFQSPEEVIEAVRRRDITYEQFCAELALLAALRLSNKQCGELIGLDGNSFLKGRLTPALREAAANAGVDYDTFLKQFRDKRKAYRTRMAQEAAANAVGSGTTTIAPTTGQTMTMPSSTVTASDAGSTMGSATPTTAATPSWRGQSRRVNGTAIGVDANSVPYVLAREDDDDVVMGCTEDNEQQTQSSTRRSVRIKAKEDEKKKNKNGKK